MTAASSNIQATLLLVVILTLGCSNAPGPGGQTPLVETAGGMPALAPPEYPNRFAPRPSVPASNFTEGPALDWEDPAASSPQRVQPRFSNGRSFEETARWIKSTLDTYLEQRADPWLTVISDVRFRACVLEWDERILYRDYNPPLVNEYIHSVNLADLDLHSVRVASNGNHVEINWNAPGNTVVSRTWEKANGSWRMKGQGTDSRTRAHFPVAPRDNVAARLAHAFVHAARLCGAVPRY